MAEWDWEKNDKLGFNPNEITSHSGKKVWWICKNGHEWEAEIVNRTAKTGCPYCSGKKVLPGFNDLLTTNPKLASDWHPTKNRNLLPTMVSSGSHKKVWWTCKNGHEWQAEIANRNAGNGCPICRKNKGKKYNC